MEDVKYAIVVKDEKDGEGATVWFVEQPPGFTREEIAACCQAAFDVPPRFVNVPASLTHHLPGEDVCHFDECLHTSAIVRVDTNGHLFWHDFPGAEKAARLLWMSWCEDLRQDIAESDCFLGAARERLLAIARRWDLDATIIPEIEKEYL